MPRKRANRQGYVEPSGWDVWIERGRAAARFLLAGPLGPDDWWTAINSGAAHANNSMAWLDGKRHVLYDPVRRLWRLTSGGVRFAEQEPKVPGAAPEPEQPAKRKRAKKVKPPPKPQPNVNPRPATKVDGVCSECGQAVRKKRRTCSRRCTDLVWRRLASASPLRSQCSIDCEKRLSARADGSERHGDV